MIFMYLYLFMYLCHCVYSLFTLSGALLLPHLLQEVEALARIPDEAARGKVCASLHDAACLHGACSRVPACMFPHMVLGCACFLTVPVGIAQLAL